MGVRYEVILRDRGRAAERFNTEGTEECRGHGDTEIKAQFIYRRDAEDAEDAEKN